jgi:hypothetical protein
VDSPSFFIDRLDMLLLYYLCSFVNGGYFYSPAYAGPIFLVVACIIEAEQEEQRLLEFQSVIYISV